MSKDKTKKVPKSFSFDEEVLTYFLDHCEEEFKNPSKIMNRLLGDHVKRLKSES